MATKSKKKKKSNQNYSAKLADGRRVTVKNGVKTYSSGSSGGSSKSAPVSGNKPSGVDKNLFLQQGETPDQYKARTESYFKTGTTPELNQPSPELKDLSIKMAKNQPVETPITPPKSPQDYAKDIVSGMQNPDTSGIGTQSTQGDEAPGVQPGVNDAVAGAMPQQTGVGSTGSVGSTPGTNVPTDPTLMNGGTPMSTVATGGYQKIGPAYFQRSSDGMRAVSDPSIISGLKHGTIPYSNGQLDGTIFSKNSVPLLNQGQAITTPPASTTNQGATPYTTYESYQQKYGLTQDQTGFFSDPKGTISSMTEEIYKITGIQEANDAIKGITEDLEDIENKRDDEIADVNDNPWLTEGIRMRQISSIEGRYEDKIANRTNKLRLLEDVRNNAQQQAQFAIGTAISLWDKERTFQQHQIDSWNEQAQREFTNKMAVMGFDQEAYQFEATQARGAYEFDANLAISKFVADTNASNAQKNREIDWYNAETSRMNSLKANTNGLDAVTARELQGKVDSSDELIRLSTQYRALVNDKGFSYSGPFGDRETQGKVQSLRGQMMAAYKKAEALGTLDAGVTALMDRILGDEPVSGAFTPLTNFTGGRSQTIVSSVDSLLEGLYIQRNRDAARLGLDPIGTAAPAQIWTSPSGNTYNLPGMNSNSTTTSI